jgi:hypothetical protein
MLTICALYSTAAAAEASLQELKSLGIGDEELTVMFEGNVPSEILDRNRFTGERAAGVIAGGDRVAPALAKIGLPENSAVRYAQRIENEKAILVCARFPNLEQVRRGQRILQQTGGEDIASIGEALPIENDKNALASEQQLDTKLLGPLGQT